MGQDYPAARAAKKKMLAANPDTGMEVPQSEASKQAAREFMRAVFGPAEKSAGGPLEIDTSGNLDDAIFTDIARAAATHPSLAKRVSWSSDLIPEKGTRAFFMPPSASAGMFGGSSKGRINVSPDFKHQIDNVWHELSHVIGLQDFDEGQGVTAHDVTEASRRINRPADVALVARSNALRDKLK